MSEDKHHDAADGAALPQTRLWDGDGFATDVWRSLADEEALPSSGAIVVSLARWQRERHLILAGGGRRVGVRVGPDEQIGEERSVIDGLRLIVLLFPKFTDGRAYSTARRLREQLGFEGELRASGDVLFDQLPLMIRCGFGSFEITDAATIRKLERSAPPVSLASYQQRLLGRMCRSTADGGGARHLSAAE
ncbi:MAG: DUF934 domain-containing protein [Hyphomicrobiaceae bacterium]|nr:DUF934 domain-containing protein [Hyphomicrobiaceae bacterium]